MGGPEARVVPGAPVRHNRGVTRDDARGEKTHFTMSEAAALFGLTVQALHHWLKTGRIRRRERTSSRGNYRIPRGEVARLLAEMGREVPGLWERRRPKVLVIDDDSGIRKLAMAVARSPKMPLSLRTASNVEDGLLSAAQFRPEVILLDTSFPPNRLRGDQGLAFIRATKVLGKVRVIAMVNSTKIGEGMVRGGADGFLVKPFSLEDFRRAAGYPLTASSKLRTSSSACAGSLSEPATSDFRSSR